VLAVGLEFATVSASAAEPPVGPDAVRRVLASRCLRCHGGVRERADLNLGSNEGIRRGGASGHPIVVPGDPAASELWKRIVSADPDERMPPEGDPIPEAERELLRRWIEQGGELTQPWAFVAPVEPDLPPGGDAWPRRDLDRFVWKRLAEAGLEPAAEADRATLCRRLHLDLIGLPPTAERLAAFLADGRPDAHERLVDELLASSRFGERWARGWLDLARFADTQGYEKDGRRTIWAWRDWIIGALDRDLPYDEIVVRCLAGDLLPDATDDDRIATAFHRNTLTNTEGGTDNEEFRMAAVFDRVATTWQGFLGTTFQCVQCHGHPYEPIRHDEYFRFLAFLDQTEDADRDDEQPVLETRPPFWRERLLEAEASLRAAGLDEAALAAWCEARMAEGEAAAIPGEAKAALAKPPADRDATDRAWIALASRADDAEVAREFAILSRTSVPVMRDLPADRRRVTRFLERGSLASPTFEVTPDVPAALPPFPAEAARDRLGLARWIVSPDNPLFDRVAVNRAWETLFGRGLVETSEDFGSQGTPPDDRELLDHLAVRFRELGRSWKSLLREIVTSATYRQSAVASVEARRVDPENRRHSRAPRFRLEAESIRDATLFAAGLLSERKFGPSVMPPQPEGVWAVVYSGDSWQEAIGPDRYRRAIYTFWRRSSPYPSLVAFDATSRETCAVRRGRSNTPLAALVTLNDPAFVEAARALAARAAEAGTDPESILEAMFLRTVARPPRADEAATLHSLFEAERRRFADDPEATRSWLGAPADAIETATAERAAWTSVAQAILNLDEFLSRG
jgi:hypothetical protein